MFGLFDKKPKKKARKQIQSTGAQQASADHETKAAVPSLEETVAQMKGELDEVKSELNQIKESPFYQMMKTVKEQPKGKLDDVLKLAEGISDEMYRTVKSELLQKMSEKGYLDYNRERGNWIHAYDWMCVNSKVGQVLGRLNYLTIEGKENFELYQGARFNFPSAKFMKKEDLAKALKDNQEITKRMEEGKLYAWTNVNTDRHKGLALIEFGLRGDEKNELFCRLREEGVEDLLAAYAFGLFKGAMEERHYAQAREVFDNYALGSTASPFLKGVQDAIMTDPAAAGYFTTALRQMKEAGDKGEK